MDHDLQRAFTEISVAPQLACHARKVKKTGHSVWKYRARSSDMKRGNRGGFRILAYYSEAEQVLYPFLVDTHEQYPDQPPREKIKSALEELLDELVTRQRRLFDDQE